MAPVVVGTLPSNITIQAKTARLSHERQYWKYRNFTPKIQRELAKLFVYSLLAEYIVQVDIVISISLKLRIGRHSLAPSCPSPGAVTNKIMENYAPRCFSYNRESLGEVERVLYDKHRDRADHALPKQHSNFNLPWVSASASEIQPSNLQQT